MTQTVPSLHRPGHLTSPPFEVRVVIGRNVVALRGGASLDVGLLREAAGIAALCRGNWATA